MFYWPDLGEERGFKGSDPVFPKTETLLGSDTSLYIPFLLYYYLSFKSWLWLLMPLMWPPLCFKTLDVI